MTARTPIDLFHTVNGLRLHTAFWPGEGDPILLLHATGFHARCWDAVVRRLPGRPVFAVDLPCHGGSDAVRPPPGWDATSDLVTELERQLDLRRVTGAGQPAIRGLPRASPARASRGRVTAPERRRARGVRWPGALIRRAS